MRKLKAILIIFLTFTNIFSSADLVLSEGRIPFKDKIYVCPICKIISLNPRKCPICGDEMLLAEKISKVFVCPVDGKEYSKGDICPDHPYTYLDPAIAIYRCPLHQDVVTFQPGKCPKCNRVLKRELIVIKYQCPKCGILSSDLDTCPICGRKMQPIHYIEPFEPSPESLEKKLKRVSSSSEEKKEVPPPLP